MRKFVRSTHCKPGEFNFNKPKFLFTFDQPLELGSEEWVMGVTSLEVSNAVYKLTQINSPFYFEIDHETVERLWTTPKIFIILTAKTNNEPSSKD